MATQTVSPYVADGLGAAFTVVSTAHANGLVMFLFALTRKSRGSLITQPHSSPRYRPTTEVECLLDAADQSPGGTGSFPLAEFLAW